MANKPYVRGSNHQSAAAGRSQRSGGNSPHWERGGRSDIARFHAQLSTARSDHNDDGPIQDTLFAKRGAKATLLPSMAEYEIIRREQPIRYRASLN